VTPADLLVVGGGPAGAALAAMAAGRGARVVVLEREAFPREKVCGEFLSAEGCTVLERLGLLDAMRAAGAPRVTSCLLADARGRSVTSPLPSPALGISRAVLDDAILALAARRGADVRRVSVAAPLVEDGVVRGVVAARTGETLRARLVAGADGRRSALQRALHPGIGDPLATGDRSWFGIQAHLPDPCTGARGQVELYVFDGGYAGLGPVEGERWNLALIVTVRTLRACGGAPERLFRERVLGNPLLAERLAGVAPCSPWRAVGPLRFNVRRPTSHGALFVGDAAGTIDPFSGEGTSNALRGAELSLPIVMDALAAGALTPALARRWSRAWRAAFAPVSRRTRLLGRLFEHERTAALAMSLLSMPRAAAILPRLVAATRTGR